MLTPKKRILNIRPIMFVCASFCCGLFFGLIIIYTNISFSLFLSSLFIILFIILPVLFRKRDVLLFILVGLFFITGFFVMTNKVGNFNKAAIPEKQYVVTGTVCNVTNFEQGFKYVTLNKIKFKNTNIFSNYKLILSITTESEIMRGDKITFSGVIENYNILSENRLSTNFIKDIKYYSSATSVNFVLTPGTNNIFDNGYKFIYNTLKSALGTDEISVGLALMTGDDSFMDHNLLNEFRQGGIAHVFAISGLHIGFLSTLLSFLLKRFKKLKLIIIPIVLVFYSGICGFTSSSLRASVMITVSLFASKNGEKYDSLSALSLAALILLMISPTELFSAGFILSFSVVFSILTLGVWLSKKFKKLPKIFSNNLPILISAYVGSIPPLLYFFGTFSLISIIANFILIPLISILFMMLFVGIIVGGLFKIAFITLYIQNLFIKFIIKTIMLFEFDIFMITHLKFTLAILLIYLLIIISCEMINIINFKRTLCLFLSTIIIFSSLVASVNDYYSLKICVSTSINTNVVCLTKESKTSVFVIDVNYPFSTGNIKSYLLKNNLKVIDELIILDPSASVGSTTTIFNNISKVKKVIYHSDYDGDYSEFFNNLILFEKFDYSEFYYSQFGSIYFYDKGVTFYKSDIEFLFLGDDAIYEDYYSDALICSNPNELIFDNFKYVLSFTKTELFANCKNEGNLIYKILNGELKRV